MCFEDNPFTDTHTQGQLTGSIFYVADIVYDRGARARFLANDLTVGNGAPEGDIWGRGGVFEFQQTWDYVLLLNASNLNMVTNIIDVVNTDNPPRIDIRVDDIQDTPGLGMNAGGLLENTVGATFDFDIKYKFPLSLVQLKNTCAFSCAGQNPFIRLDDYIENPLGTTEINNASGDILSGPGSEIIRTNILDLDAPHGNIGQQSPTHAEPDPVRNPIMVELVKYKNPDPAFCPGGAAPCVKDFVATVDAGKDVVLDLTANRRTDEALGSALTVTIERINAGNDVDLVVNDSKNGNDQSSLTLVVIDMFNPATPFYGYVYYNSLRPWARPGQRSARHRFLRGRLPGRLRHREWPLRDTLPPGCARPEPCPHPAGARHGDDRHRLDLRLQGRPSRRRHRHLPRERVRQRRAEDLLHDGGQRRDPRGHQRHPGQAGQHHHQHRCRLDRRQPCR